MQLFLIYWLLHALIRENYQTVRSAVLTKERRMEFKDYYKTLGVEPTASTDEIKRAYRKLARQYHPDVSKVADAEAKFKEINEAWEALKDPAKRQQYDSFRQAPPESRGAGFGQSFGNDFYSGDHPEDFNVESAAAFSDFFNSLFGARRDSTRYHQSSADAHSHRRGQDLHTKVKIPLEVAYTGGVQTLQYHLPGKGMHNEASMKTLQVKIPKGVVRGSQIRLKGQGAPDVGGASFGDLYVEIDFSPHPYFSVQQKDIHLTLPITPWEAALGATIEVPTLGGKVNVKIPQDVSYSQPLRLKERGLPGEPAGSQYIHLQIVTPKPNTPQAVALYQEMAKLMPFNPREKIGR